jgi:hypothetical protein
VKKPTDILSCNSTDDVWRDCCLSGAEAWN